MPAPAISFVIPVRNDARRLAACLLSIARNRYPAGQVEVIVVDNGSTDDSRQVAQAAGAVVLHITDSGLSSLRNRGAAAARGRILAFVDADHELGPDWIATAVRALSVSGVGAAGAACWPPADGSWVQRRYDALREHAQTAQDVEWLGSGNMAVRLDLFNALGGFDVSLDTCEDADLSQRIRAQGERIVAEPGMHNVHLGDPATLRAVFFGELWRGRDNLRVTLRGRYSLRHLRSALIPIADLAALGAAVAGPLLRAPIVTVAAAAMVLALAAMRTAVMLRRQVRPNARAAAQTFAVAAVYDVARALALLRLTGHGARRASEKSTHVPANSHP